MGNHRGENAADWVVTAGILSIGRNSEGRLGRGNIYGKHMPAFQRKKLDGLLLKTTTSVETCHVDYLSKSAPSTKDVGVEHLLPQKRVNIRKKSNYVKDMYKYLISFKNVQ